MFVWWEHVEKVGIKLDPVVLTVPRIVWLQQKEVDKMKCSLGLCSDLHVVGHSWVRWWKEQVLFQQCCLSSGDDSEERAFWFSFFSSQTLILVLKLRSDPQFWHVNCKYDTLPALYTVIVFEKLFLWNSLSFWCRNKSGLEVSDKRENKIGLSVSLCCHHWTSCLLSCLLSCSSSLH